MKFHAAIVAGILAVSVSGCAVLRAGNHVTDVFMRESDPVLAAQALPTMMKAAEALALADPGNEAKALSAASLHVMYANAFLDSEAFLLPDEKYEEKLLLTTRAHALYRRAAYELKPFIEAKSPGVFEGKPVTGMKATDAALLYWTTAAILGGFASDPMDFELATLVAGAVALFEQARTADPDWNNGSLHDLAITVYGSLPSDLGGSKDRAEAAYRRSLEIGKGQSPGPLVSYAQAILVAREDREAFAETLGQALAMPVRPESALMDTLAHRKARKLLDDIDLYFY